MGKSVGIGNIRVFGSFFFILANTPRYSKTWIKKKLGTVFDMSYKFKENDGIKFSWHYKYIARYYGTYRYLLNNKSHNIGQNTRTSISVGN